MLVLVHMLVRVLVGVFLPYIVGMLVGVSMLVLVLVLACSFTSVLMPVSCQRFFFRFRVFVLMRLFIMHLYHGPLIIYLL